MGNAARKGLRFLFLTTLYRKHFTYNRQGSIIKEEVFTLEEQVNAMVYGEDVMKKRSKKICNLISGIVAISVILLLIYRGSTTSYGNSSGRNQAIEAQTISMDIQRVEKNIVNDKNDTIGQMYFKKPVFSSAINTPAVNKMNQYFDDECDGFFYGSEKSQHFKEGFYNQFYHKVIHSRELYTDAELKEVPVCNVVETIVYVQDDKYISILEYQIWGDVSNSYNYNRRYYGITFDITTGDIVPVSNFLPVSESVFNQEVITLLTKYYESEGYIMNEEMLEKQFSNKHFGDYNYFCKKPKNGEYDLILLFNNSPYTIDSFVLQYPSGKAKNEAHPVEIITDPIKEPYRALISTVTVPGEGRSNQSDNSKIVYEVGDTISSYGIANGKSDNGSRDEVKKLKRVLNHWTTKNNLKWDQWSDFIKTDKGYFVFVNCNHYTRYFLIELNDDFTIYRVSEKLNPTYHVS